MWVMTSVETLGYYRMPLRDKDLSQSGVFCGSKSWRHKNVGVLPG